MICTLCIALTNCIYSQIMVDYIIKDINIIPMTKDTVIEKQSVAFYNGKIIAINSFKQIKKNKDTKIIDATGKYLMPGLTEMHLHLPTAQKLEPFLSTVVAAGVTNLRIMHSDEPIKTQRKLIESLLVKPKIYYPYELTKETNLKTLKQFDSLFAIVKREKYDFVKQYSINWNEGFTEAIFDNMMNAANRNDLMVCGHYPSKVKFEKVIKSGFKSIEHLGGYVDLPDDKLAAALDLTKTYGTYNCPTLDWDVMAYDLPYPNDYTKRLIIYNAPQKLIDTWSVALVDAIKKTGADKIVKDKDAYLPTFNKKMAILKKMNDSGCNLILGGESENLYQLEGFNMYEEMVNWSKAGINNYSILKAATVNPAKFFNEDKTRGTVEVGKEANLIILETNPLKDISNIKTIENTIIKGVIYNKKDLLSKI